MVRSGDAHGSGRASEEAFDTFFAISRDHVVGLIALSTHDPAAAEDAAQEAFTRAYKRWAHVSTLERPDLWVVRVGINVAIDGWRKRKLEHALDTEQHAPADDRIDAMWIEWGLAHLSPRQREAVILSYAEGLGRDEVARRMGSTTATIKTHLERARRRLRDVLKGDATP